MSKTIFETALFLTLAVLGAILVINGNKIGGGLDRIEGLITTGEPIRINSIPYKCEKFVE
jgi:hypothetical protein